MPFDPAAAITLDLCGQTVADPRLAGGLGLGGAFDENNPV
ncbi:hypothetical protein MITS9509_00504 [Synechococcus sp. MIT S9509]|nr:hypothetical protein MITS9509_00504 [Synechococcus sp. MIT S9509]